MTYDEGTLIGLLARRHSEDIFVPKCKNGSTLLARKDELKILDAWAMNRSWTQLTFSGYEIKVSRSDFLADEKWQDYRAYCHLFYFVCPPKLIDPGELPEGVGLLVCSTNAKQLYTKRRAVRRDIEIPVNLLLYILMSRALITDAEYNGRLEERAQRIEYWRQVLKQNDDALSLAAALRSKIRRTLQDAAGRTMKAERLAAELETIRDRILELGFDPDEGINTWQVSQKLRQLRNDIPEDLVRDTRVVAKRLAELAETMVKVRGDGNAT